MSEPDSAVIEAAASDVDAAANHAEVELGQNEAIEQTAEVSIAAGEAAIEAQETAEAGVMLGAVAVEAVAETQETVAEHSEAIAQVADATEATAYASLQAFSELSDKLAALEARFMERKERDVELDDQMQTQTEVHEIQVSDSNEGKKTNERTEQPRRHKFGRR